MFFGAGVGYGAVRETSPIYGRVKAPTFSFRNESVSRRPRSEVVVMNRRPLLRRLSRSALTASPYESGPSSTTSPSMTTPTQWVVYSKGSPS
jgi:hypothetical protein